MTKTILRLEGLVVFLLAAAYYFAHDFNWLLFAIFLLAPDISMIGYIVNNRLGACVYNIFHTYVISLLFIFLSVIANSEILLLIGLIWTAHIGMDRAFGYGLKNTAGFKDTHLGRL